MFNPLTRTLRLGLTAIAFLIAGGFAFAPTAAEAQVTEEHRANCRANPWGTAATTYFKTYWDRIFTRRSYRYSTGGCTAVLSQKELSYQRVRVCTSSHNYRQIRCTRKQTGLPQAVNYRPNEANWAWTHYASHYHWLPDGPYLVPTKPYTATSGNAHLRRQNQLLLGTASGVNKGDIVTSSWGDKSLNLNTATFNKQPLRGDATDGVAFIVGKFNNRGSYYAYAGIFSGTDLGAPVTQTSGTASWGGEIQAANYGVDKDFVLEVSFRSNGGYIRAFVDREGENYYSSDTHYLLKGDFDNTGLIIGTVEVGNFTDNDRNRPTDGSGYIGLLTGLIGKEGAVGAFISDNTGSYAFSGGFVARPGVGQSTIRTICNADPFHEFCHIGTAGKTAMEALRRSRIAHCIQDGNALKGNKSGEVKCQNAIKHNPCIGNPFGTDCATNVHFSSYTASAQANRIEFCNLTGNIDNDLCTSNVDDICTNAPFAPFCTSKIGYESRRVTRAQICVANLRDPRCTGVRYVSLSSICTRVPFGRECTSGTYQSYRAVQAKTCADNMRASGCNSSYYVTPSTVCELVPFGRACTSSRYQNDRAVQAKTCADNMRASGCDSSYRVTPSKICELVPFGRSCTSGSYQSYRVAQAKTCADNMRASGCDSSYHVTPSEICELVPFGGDCTSGTYQNDRVTQAKTCAGDLDASGCDDSYHVTRLKICNLIPFGTECTSSSYESQRIVRAKRCVRSPSDLLCSRDIVTPANICSQIPFDLTCTGYDLEQLKRARLCVDDNGENLLCDKRDVTTADICGQLPFDSTCTAYEIERFHRAKRCVRTPNDLLCDRNEVTMANICSQLPFRSDCTGYDVERLARAKRCVLSPDDLRCGRDVVTMANICSQLPFNSTCEGSVNERLDRAQLCVDNDGEDPLCNPQYVSLEDICSYIPFASTCSDTRFEHYRTGRITFCNDVLNKRNRRCIPTEVVDAVCNDNLFGTGCVNSVDSGGVYADKRTVRIRICNEADGVNNPLCMPADVVAAICADNLFGTGCVNSLDPDGVYAGERTERLDFCSIASNSGNFRCLYKNRDNICSYAPFSPVCVGHTASEGKRTASKFNACRNPGPNNLTCHGISQALPLSGKADATTWAESFITLENPGGISSITSVDVSDFQYRKNQFVEGLEVLEEGFNLRTRSKTPFTVLTLGDNLVDSTETLGGESEDGVAFFGLYATDYGYRGYRSFPFYAGILSGTDLGAPITRTADIAGTWSGVFQAIGGTARAIKRNFDLTVDFTDDTTGTIEAFVKAKGDEHYHLTGTFNNIGVITGTVDYGLFRDNKSTEPISSRDRRSGRLTGLIGKQGAVGAFIADMDRDNGYYSGGFVAAAPEVVEYADWVEITTPDNTRTTPLTNQFLTGSDGTVASGSPVTITLKNALYEGAIFNGDDNDGVQLFTNPTGTVTNVYAGILQTTSLGAPLDATTAAGRWEGRLFASLVAGAPAYEVADFRPTINFTTSSISATITGVTRDNGAALPNSVSYNFSAEFDTNGVFEGTIARSIAGVASAGKLTGLIGAEGAVGAFISNPSVSVSYAGGFVARPPQ